MTDPLHIFDMDITSFTEVTVPGCPECGGNRTFVMELTPEKFNLGCLDCGKRWDNDGGLLPTGADARVAAEAAARKRAG